MSPSASLLLILLCIFFSAVLADSQEELNEEVSKLVELPTPSRFRRQLGRIARSKYSPKISEIESSSYTWPTVDIAHSFLCSPEVCQKGHQDTALAELRIRWCNDLSSFRWIAIVDSSGSAITQSSHRQLSTRASNLASSPSWTTSISSLCLKQSMYHAIRSRRIQSSDLFLFNNQRYNKDPDCCVLLDPYI